jgi:hypothetical protein
VKKNQKLYGRLYVHFECNNRYQVFMELHTVEKSNKKSEKLCVKYVSFWNLINSEVKKKDAQYFATPSSMF